MLGWTRLVDKKALQSVRLFAKKQKTTALDRLSITLVRKERLPNQN